MIFSAGPGRITLDDTGSVVEVLHEDRPDRSYLGQTGQVAIELAGLPVAAVLTNLREDRDEVEVTWQLDDRLGLTVRHTFAAGWGMRLAMVNLSSVTQRLDRAVWAMSAGPDHIGWALAAGSEAAFSVHPADGSGPLLGGVLRLGSITRIDQTGAELGPIELTPHGRYIVSWQWDWFRHPRAFGRGRHPGVPASFFLTTGQSARIAASSDTALVAPGLEIITDDVSDAVELVAHSAGEYDVELRSSTGLVGYHILAADPVEDGLASLAEQLVAGPRTPAGVVRIDDPAAGLVIQYALTRGGFAQVDDAAEALDRLVARLSADVPAEPLALAFLAGQAVTEADGDLLQTADAALFTYSAPAAGLGLAMLRLRAASLVLGAGMPGVLDHLRGIAAPLWAAGPDEDWAVSATRDLAELELLAVLASATSHATPEPGVGARIARLGLRLGGGLKGRPAIPEPVVTLARFAVVFDLLPEQLSVAFRQRWLCSPGDLARRARIEVVQRCASQLQTPTGSSGDHVLAAAWLTLAQSTAG